MRKIAIFGGAFNPIHWGHLLIAETALDQFGLDQIIWVPTFHPPHKGQSLLAFEHRFAMVQQAIADHPAFVASAIDAQRQGISYAIDTLNDLHSRHPQTDWYWIVGVDAFQSLPQWRASRELVDRCVWLVAPRQGDGLRLERSPLGQALPYQWHYLTMPLVDISASLVRERCRQGHSIRYLVPDTVRIYIHVQKLYQMS